MLSFDMETKTFVVSRNNESPVIVYTNSDGLYLLEEPSRCVGVYRSTKPVITELPIAVGTILVVFTDGLRHAGSLSGRESYDPVSATRRMIAAGTTEARILADTLLAEATAMDNGRPSARRYQRAGCFRTARAGKRWRAADGCFVTNLDSEKGLILKQSAQASQECQGFILYPLCSFASLRQIFR